MFHFKGSPGFHLLTSVSGWEEVQREGVKSSLGCGVSHGWMEAEGCLGNHQPHPSITQLPVKLISNCKLL